MANTRYQFGHARMECFWAGRDHPNITIEINVRMLYMMMKKTYFLENQCTNQGNCLTIPKFVW